MSDRPSSLRPSGRHVRRRAQHGPFLGRRPRGEGGGVGRGLRRLQQLGQAEVHNFDPAFVVDHDVGRLQVPVEDAGAVGLGQRVGDLDGVLQRLGRAQALGGYHLVERPALDVLHYDEVHAVVAVDVVEGDDVGVIQRAGGLGLLDEALLASRIGRFAGGQDFDRHGSVEVSVASLVDDAHAALPELRFNSVVVERTADHGEGGRPCPSILGRLHGQVNAPLTRGCAT